MSRWHRNERRWLWKGTRTGWKRVAMKKRGRCLDVREKKRRRSRRKEGKRKRCGSSVDRKKLLKESWSHQNHEDHDSVVLQKDVRSI